MIRPDKFLRAENLETLEAELNEILRPSSSLELSRTLPEELELPGLVDLPRLIRRNDDRLKPFCAG